MTEFLPTLAAKVLDSMAYGEPAAEILQGLCLSVERKLPGSIVGVTILDRSAKVFEHAIFPSLAGDYARALNGILVADKPGSCALAVFEGRTVECTDVSFDGRFSEGWKELGLKHGLRALVSIPAMNRQGIALGTLVVAYPPGTPLSDGQRALADEVAALCAKVLAYRRIQLGHELLIGELQHRVRNLFSTVGAVVYATLRAHPQPDEFRKHFDGRLRALSRAHSMALETEQVELRQLLSDMLAPYSLDHPIAIDGPPLMLSQGAAIAFSLAAHELATNAAKYGALSRHGGSLRIAWACEPEAESDQFTLRWEEIGGPEVSPPSHEGFGQKTLQRSIASAIDGRVELAYEPAGLQCTVKAPYSDRLGNLIH